LRRPGDRLANAGRYPRCNDARRHPGIGRHDGACPHDASPTDDRSAEDDGIATDECAVFDRAIVENRAVSDGHVVADGRDSVVRCVNDRVVFDCAARSNSDRSTIGANDHPEPN